MHIYQSLYYIPKMYVYIKKAVMENIWRTMHQNNKEYVQIPMETWKRKQIQRTKFDMLVKKEERKSTDLHCPRPSTFFLFLMSLSLSFKLRRKYRSLTIQRSRKPHVWVLHMVFGFELFWHHRSNRQQMTGRTAKVLNSYFDWLTCYLILLVYMCTLCTCFASSNSYLNINILERNLCGTGAVLCFAVYNRLLEAPVHVWCTINGTCVPVVDKHRMLPK